jgi:dinuclear metal center YbgI/SA1388 family protein
MTCNEIIEMLEQEFPLKYAMPGDKTGFQVGNREQEIHHIYIAVDATEEVIDEAVRVGADLLLTHHPMIFSPLATITTDSFQGRRVIKMIQNNLCYVSTHTNYDSCRMADLAADRLGIIDGQVLEEVADGLGIGKMGILPKEMTLRECAVYVKEAFGIPSVRFFGDGNEKVSRVAICPGSGRSVIKYCHALGAEVFITGDIDHHTGVDQVDDALPIIDAGHYGIEHIYIEDMQKILEEKYPQLKITAAKIRHPFEVV